MASDDVGFRGSRNRPMLTATDLKAEISGLSDAGSERAEMMLHFVNKWAGEYSSRDLKLAWETYSEQAEIDDKFDAIDEFIDDYGMRNLGFYEDFADTMNDYDRDAVMAFVGQFGISNISHFAESYQGTYRSEAEFAEEFISQIGDEIPPYVVVDWQETWYCGLRYDYTYDEETGAVFASKF